MDWNGLESVGGFLGDNSINITTLPGSTLLEGVPSSIPDWVVPAHITLDREIENGNENTTNLLGENLEAFFLPRERNFQTSPSVFSSLDCAPTEKIVLQDTHISDGQMDLDIYSNNHLSRDYPLCSTSLSTPGMFYTVVLLSSYQVCAKFYDGDVVICSDNADLL